MPTNSSLFQNITEPYDITSEFDAREDFRFIFFNTCLYLIEEIQTEYLITVFALIYEYCTDYLLSSLLTHDKQNETITALPERFLKNPPPNMPTPTDQLMTKLIEQSCIKNTQHLLMGMGPLSKPNPTIANVSQAIGTERLEKECHAQLLMFLHLVFANNRLTETTTYNSTVALEHDEEITTLGLRHSAAKTNYRFIFSHHDELETFKHILNSTSLLMAKALWHVKLSEVSPLLQNTFVSTVLKPMMALYRNNNTVPTRSDIELKTLPESLPLTRKKQQHHFLNNVLTKPCIRQATELTGSREESIASPQLQKASLKIGENTLKRECIYQGLLLLDQLFTEINFPPTNTKTPSPFQATQIAKRLLNAAQRVSGFNFTVFNNLDFIETKVCHPHKEKGQLISFYVYKKPTQPKLWFIHKRGDMEELLNFVKKTTRNGKTLDKNEKKDLRRGHHYLESSSFFNHTIPCTEADLKINQLTTTSCASTGVLPGRATLPTFFNLENRNTSAPPLPPHQTGVNPP